MRVSHSRAVRVVDQLEAAGLARREPDPSDGRRALVWLERAGRELAERERAVTRLIILPWPWLPQDQVAAVVRATSAIYRHDCVPVRSR